MQFLNRILRFGYQSHASVPRIPFLNGVQASGVKQSSYVSSDVPVKPKRPISSFFRYFFEIRPKLLEQHPNASYADIMKIATETWKNSDDNFKKPYNEASLRDREKYFIQLHAYESNLTVEQRAKLDKKTLNKERQKKRSVLKKEMEALGKPKKPLNAFFLFARDKKGQKSKGEPLSEWSLKLSNEWNNLPATEKNKYLDQWHILQEQYRKDLSEWEERVMGLDTSDEQNRHVQKKVARKLERVSSNQNEDGS